MNVQLTVDLPEEAFSILRTPPDLFIKEMKNAAIVKWFELGRISQSKAAEIIGISRSDFLDLLKNYNVSPFQISFSDLQKEL